MTSPALPIDPEGLLADSTWLRGLARGLVDDHFAADDLAQEAWLAALRSPSAGGPERAAGVGERIWLTGVLRNVAWKQRRTDARRRARELRGARGEELPSTGELVARAEMQRALYDAVVALGEPFRTTILLRYLEDLSSAEIARRQHVPEGTVRWRVKRGLELLRGELEDRRGNEWLHSCALVAGLFRVPETVAVAAVGASAGMLSIKAGVLVAGLTLAGGGTALSTGWIEAPWDDPEYRTASGSGTLVHTSTESSLPTSEDEATSEIVDAGDDARATRVRTPLAVRTPAEEPGVGDPPTGGPDARSGVSIHREVRIDLRANEGEDLHAMLAGLGGTEDGVFVCLATGEDDLPAELRDLDLALEPDNLECEWTDEAGDVLMSSLRETLDQARPEHSFDAAECVSTAGGALRFVHSTDAVSPVELDLKRMRIFKLPGKGLKPFELRNTLLRAAPATDSH